MQAVAAARTIMNSQTRGLFAVLTVSVCTVAHADDASFTNVIPECRMPAGGAMPGKYLRLAKRDKAFAWATRVRRTDKDAGGDGWERIDGSSMTNSFSFYRADLNNDGYCDWFLNADAPLSTGGDRDSINTLYLGKANGWLRIGAPVPDDKPDSLGYGETGPQQDRYLFGEDLAVLYDKVAQVHYMISSYAERHAQRDYRPGYRFYVWDETNRTLKMLDKWEPGSKGAAAYAYFKAQGARIPMTKPQEPGSDILRFDPQVEAFEIRHACERRGTEWAYGDKLNPISPHLRARCKR